MLLVTLQPLLSVYIGMRIDPPNMVAEIRTAALSQEIGAVRNDNVIVKKNDIIM